MADLTGTVSKYLTMNRMETINRYNSGRSANHFEWIDMEEEFFDMHNYLYDQYGPLKEADYQRVYSRWVAPYFSTYDQRVAPYCNGDHQYAPALFCWYAREMLQCPDRYPIRIMRAVYLDYLGITKPEDLLPGTKVVFMGNMSVYPYPVKLPTPPEGQVIRTAQDDQGEYIVQVDFGPECQPYLRIEDVVLLSI